ncbi:MAG: NAD(P)H-hydrate dehydratase [Gammaproteobacteria bacterium]|jgi:NAD(P)H-hydrate epimerase|nr:NAD(P)H-hydrate dehydratase [Gammaproteobacteria bacterium]
MSELPQNLYRAAQVKELDRTAIEDHGIAGGTLMNRAGEAAFGVLRRAWPRAGTILVVAGPGNNGGDGYVVARLAREAGLGVKLVFLGDPARMRGDALAARESFLACGGQARSWTGKLPPADVIVDALLGTGLEREVEGAFREIIDAINAHSAPVIAIDIPSGLHSDTGSPLGAAVNAERTVSFIGLKQGLFTGFGKACCGQVRFSDLGVPEAVYDVVRPSSVLISLERFRDRLSPRARTAHKGDFGHVLIVGGDSGMSGAARLAGEAAARTGAGLVSVATRADHAGVLNANRPELMVRGVENEAELEPLLSRATVVAIGPGLGRGEWGRRMLPRVLEVDQPVVMDADALNLLSEGAPQAGGGRVLTPHPGEAARLLGCTTSQVQHDRFAAVERIADQYGGVVVLKGSGTLIGGVGLTALCDAGNPGMATGGMGDVLTGIIAALIAQGLGLGDAAQTGVCLHASAADVVAAADGERGMLAGDLPPIVRSLVNPRRSGG